MPVSGVGPPAIDRRKPLESRGEHDIGCPLEFGVAVGEGGLVDAVRIRSLDLLERRLEIAHVTTLANVCSPNSEMCHGKWDEGGNVGKKDTFDRSPAGPRA